MSTKYCLSILSVAVVYSPLHHHEMSVVMSDITTCGQRISRSMDTAELGRWIKQPILPEMNGYRFVQNELSNWFKSWIVMCTGYQCFCCHSCGYWNVLNRSRYLWHHTGELRRERNSSIKWRRPLKTCIWLRQVNLYFLHCVINSDDTCVCSGNVDYVMFVVMHSDKELSLLFEFIIYIQQFQIGPLQEDLWDS